MSARSIVIAGVEVPATSSLTDHERYHRQLGRLSIGAMRHVDRVSVTLTYLVSDGSVSGFGTGVDWDAAAAGAVAGLAKSASDRIAEAAFAELDDARSGRRAA